MENSRLQPSPMVELKSTNTDRELWPVWAAALRRWKLDGAAAALVEGAGPLSLLLAQLMYIGQPLVQAAAPGAGFPALARLLDNPQQAAQFAAYLREEETP